MKLISWNVTKECDLSCQHCYRDAGKKAKGELTTKEAKDLLKEIKKANFNLVIFSGGEPLLRRDIYELIDYNNRLGLASSLGTNGLRLDFKAAQRLKALKLSSVGISLDSIKPDFHEHLRGMKGCWQKAIEATRNCRKVGLKFQIHTTLTKENYSDITKFVELSTRLDACAHYFFFLVPCGRAKGIKMSALSPDEHEQALSLIIQARKTAKIYLRPVCAPQFVRLLDADVRGLHTDKRGYLRKSVFEPNVYTLKEKGCLAGREYCLIGPCGDVYPCPYLPLRVGNIREKNFSQIWNDNPIFNTLRRNDLKGKCARCEFAFYCRGCRANSFYYLKDILQEDPQCIYQPDSFLDELDKKLIDYLQNDFPLVLKPFKALAVRLGISEEEVLFRVYRLKSIGIIKRIGPIYNPDKFGFRRTLVAMSVPKNRLTRAVNLVNSFKEVTHNYLRRDPEFNLWFTLICPNQKRIDSILKVIKERTGIEKMISLPTRKTIKIKAIFNA